MLPGFALFLIHAGLLGAAGLLFLLSAFLAIELIAGTFHRAAVPAPVSPFNPYVVVMPAHNEVGTIEKTLPTVIADVADGGRVVVVADNCSDETALVASAHGATVIERNDPSRHGKGYALAYAVRYLSSNPPAVVIVLDADCVPDSGSLAMLAAVAEIGRYPVQGRYELTAPSADAGPLARVGAFAWRIKNILRPYGLTALGAPCLLMGSGMAFPWHTLRSTDLDTGHLVEDMVLGLDLAARGEGPRFLPEACVRSAMPPSIEGQQSQRKRWETGHLQVIRTLVLPLAGQALAARDWRLFLLAFHAAVPPLALLVLLLLTVTAGSGLVTLLGGPVSAFCLSLAAVTVAGGVFAVYWQRVGRDLLNPRELVLVPGYVLSKLQIYRRVVSGRPVEWVRSKRD